MSKASDSQVRAMASVREAFRRRMVLAIRSADVAQADIARALDVSPSRVSRWGNPDPEQGELPSEAYLPFMPALLDVDGHWLLTGTGKPGRSLEVPEERRSLALARIERALKDMRKG